MRHRKQGRKLGRTTAHRGAMFRNMVTSLILNDRIETTLSKAKELRRIADKMITLAKRNTIHARRQAMEILRDKNALQKLFSTLVDRYKDRNGGYTRIMKLGFRHGDQAAMAVIEYLSAETGSRKTETEGKKLEAGSRKPEAGSKKQEAKPAKKAAVKKTEKKGSPKTTAKKKTATKSRSEKKTEKKSGK